ncbi:hypothetical protein [uncultured Aquabacterium sp.]|uniref:hypothetical protein n=1 Tax=uncultured Aquabacterium sp. TaxID=158753 RepID=UPI00263A1A97|nr:hypothetical protein [uncultured Aquabacterium sp.]
MYYRSTKAAPKVQDHSVKPIKAMMEENPLFGYRTVARLLSLNKNTVQRVFQLNGWQCASARWASTSHPGLAIGSQSTIRAVRDRSVPRMDVA